jgi:predicted AAA+ superfamily ATPase
MNKIHRLLYADIKKFLSDKEIILITGPRQVGKTTLMLSLKNELESTGNKTVFYNLDIERDNFWFTSQEQFIQRLQFDLPGNDGYVFIDEIQKKTNAGLFLKGLYDQNLPYKFIVSGSGSLELKEKIHESLAGRKRVFNMVPVNFIEMVDYRTDYKYSGRLLEWFTMEREKCSLWLSEYLAFGGYPRVILAENTEDKIRILDEIFTSCVEKDIGYLLKVERTDAFKMMIRILSSVTGNYINFSGLASETGISVNTLKNYLWYAEKIFLIYSLTPFFRNVKKELVKSPTIYFTDTGMRNYAAGLVGNLINPVETGFVFQNFIGNILKELIQWKGWTLHYYRTTDKAEVDFIINKQYELLPVEVKYSKLKKIEIPRSLRSFIDKYNPPNALIINLELTAEISLNSTKIKFIPWYLLFQNNILESFRSG